MRNQNFVLALFVFITGWQSSFAVQDPETGEAVEEANQVEAFQNRLIEACVLKQTVAMETELHKLTSTLNVKGEWIHSLRSSLTNEIKETVEEMPARSTSLIMDSSDRYLDRRFRDRIWSTIESKLSEEEKVTFTELKQSFFQMQNLRNQTAINTVLVTLDGELCLSAAQVDQLRMLYAQNWDSSLNGCCLQLANNGFTDGIVPIDLIGQDELSQVLNDTQRRAFSQLGQSTNKMRDLLIKARGDQHSDCEPIRKFCHLAMELKVAEYSQLVVIDDQQLKMLEIVSKGAVDSTVDELDEFFAQIDSATMNMDDMIVVEEPIVLKCARGKVWQNSLAKFLDETQMRKIEEREKARRAMRLDHALNSIAIMISQIVGSELNHDQHLRMVATVGKHIDDSVSPNCTSIMQELLSVPDEAFHDVLTDEQWSKLKPIIDRGRAPKERTKD